MNIIYTDIPDVNEENISETKLRIANSIISTIKPLFDEAFKTRQKDENSLRNKLESIRNKLEEEKVNLEKISADYKKKQKISKLLERIQKLISYGLTYDSVSKNEMVILLKILEKLPENKLDEQLFKTSTLLEKRFSKISKF
jgi:DNA repair exonuclease SbcCD ATPase subunit